jgi:hypothetical protein
MPMVLLLCSKFLLNNLSHAFIKHLEMITYIYIADLRKREKLSSESLIWCLLRHCNGMSMKSLNAPAGILTGGVPQSYNSD